MSVNHRPDQPPQHRRKEGCQTSQTLYRTGLWSYVAAHMCCSSRERKKDAHKGDSEITGAASSVSRVGGLLLLIQQARQQPSGAWRVGPLIIWDCDPPPAPVIAAEVRPPHWVWKAKDRTQKDYSQASRSNIIYLMRFWNYLGSDTLFFLPISPFGEVYPVHV